MLPFTVLTLLILSADLSIASPAHKAKMPNRHKSSQESASPVLPFSTFAYSQAAGLCQQTYCADVAIGQQVGDAKLLFTTGDGDAIQRVNIYYSATLGVTVAYQGTNISSLTSALHDVDYALISPDPRLGLPAGAQVDSGFQAAWLASYLSVSNALEQLRGQYAGARLTVVGHSLGAAQALLAGLALQHLYGVDGVITCKCIPSPNTVPTSGTTLKTLSPLSFLAVGLPRTGNAIFADAVDSVLAEKFSYVVNGRDWVPHTPFPFLGYQHPSGQVWINPANTTNWAFYPGQENVNGKWG